MLARGNAPALMSEQVFILAWSHKSKKMSASGPRCSPRTTVIHHLGTPGTLCLSDFCNRKSHVLKTTPKTPSFLDTSVLFMGLVFYSCSFTVIFPRRYQPDEGCA